MRQNFSLNSDLGRTNQMPAYCLHMCCDQGVCVEIEADTAATLTKIAEAACFLSLQSVCEKWCVLFIDRGYFRAGGPSSCPPYIGPFIAPSSIFIAAQLSSPISDQLAVTDVSLNQSHASLCGNISTSQCLHPTLYNGFFAFFFF